MNVFDALQLADQGIPVHCTGWAKPNRINSLPFPPGTYIVGHHDATNEQGGPLHRWHLPQDWQAPAGFIQMTFTNDEYHLAYSGFAYEWGEGGLPIVKE